MVIKQGDRLPAGKLRRKDADRVEEVDVEELMRGKKAVLFAVPGAFTPTCSNRHLPGFVKQIEGLRAKGVELVACLSVNDAHVMAAWGRDHKTEDKVMMLADGSAVYTKALGLETDSTAFGMGIRSRRYAMIVEDGTVTRLFVEEPGKFEASAVENVLANL